MSELVYRKEYRVHTYEVDVRAAARPVALLNYLQDAAGEHAARLGFSVADLLRRGLTWVLSRNHVLVHRYPRVGERLEVATWPSGKHGYYALRDFEVGGAGGEAVLSATTSWMVIDVGRKQPVKVDELLKPGCVLEKRALPDAFGSLPVPSATEHEARFRADSGHLDLNRHVNNAVYVHWALEALPSEFLGKRRVVDLEVSYRAEAFRGEEVLSVAQAVAGGDGGPAFLHQILNAVSGLELARLRTGWE